MMNDIHTLYEQIFKFVRNRQPYRKLLPNDPRKMLTSHYVDKYGRNCSND